MISLSHFRALRPAGGTILRIAVDIGSTWAAFVFGWLLGEGGDLTASITQAPARTVALGGLLLGCAFAACTATGLHNGTHSYTLSVKVRRIILINLAFLMVGCAVSAFTEGLTAFKLLLFLTTFTGSTLLLCLVRAGADVVRREVRHEDNGISRAESREKKVLVIGGAGYIGSALVQKLLDQGLRVLVLDAMHFGEETLRLVATHPNLTIVRDDFRHIEVLTRAMTDVGSVIHLGGLVGDPACAFDADLTVDVNVTATKLIGEIAKAAGVRRFIFASSCSVYGACDKIVTEESRFNPLSLYARTKVASEVVLDALNSPDFGVTRLRFATIHGVSGRTRFDLVVNLLCAKAVRDGLITVFGADQIRPFAHVEDVATAIMMTLQAPLDLVAGEAFNVGSDAQNYTLGDVAKLINKQVPDSKIVSDDTFVDKRSYHVSFKKFHTRLGFWPAWTLERGIAQVVASLRSNEIGHYSLPEYSNVLSLKERGIKSFSSFNITGWEHELMNS
ncbi:MAG: NAD-dependent epimerase/dehydratase family protein [Pseudomonadota bacterium]|nr:NAD-dependent epimerase/dehydratase family protein [Pseudomonadota bacterium]